MTPSSGRDDLDFAPTLHADGQIILARRYRVVKELGRGGMGTVYLAEDAHLENRKVAIKMPSPILARNPRALQALKREASLAMQLSHPHIVTLRAFEQGDDGVFLVMDYVSGKTLEQILVERDKLIEEEAIRIFTPIAQALDYAHSRKVIHRDIKPSNILIADDGTPYIMDFGVAREMKDTYTRITGKSDTSGTLPYMSPEQLRGEQPSPAQDIYSFAATLYECLAGHPPFHMGQIEWQIVNQEAVRLSNCSPQLAVAIASGLSKSTASRPADCVQVVSGSGVGHALSTLPASTVSLTKPALLVADPPKWPRQGEGEQSQMQGSFLIVCIVTLAIGLFGTLVILGILSFIGVSR